MVFLLNYKRIGLLLAVGALLAITHSFASADAAGDKRRAQLANVHRVVVVPPFFGTETLAKADAPPSDSKPANPKLAEYVEQLRKLESRARTGLPERLAARTRFEVVPADEVTAALKALELTPGKLYQNNGRMKGTKFANPDPQAVRKLADRVHADAVLLATLDEPRRSSDHYFFDPLSGIGFSEAHVRAKIGFWLLLADGTESFQRVSEVVHPLTRIGKREYLFVDWQEADDLAIENFLDELTRYTPPK